MKIIRLAVPGCGDHRFYVHHAGEIVPWLLAFYPSWPRQVATARPRALIAHETCWPLSWHPTILLGRPLVLVPATDNADWTVPALGDT